MIQNAPKLNTQGQKKALVKKTTPKGHFVPWCPFFHNIWLGATLSVVPQP